MFATDGFVRTLALPAIACVLLTGCADGFLGTGSGSQRASVGEVRESELRPYSALGTGTLAGSASLARPGGPAGTCAGAVVRLYPAITAVREAYEAYNAGRHVENNPNLDVRVTAVRRQTVCDPRGQFRFGNLPAGEWVVATEVRVGTGSTAERRLVHRLVNVRAGGTTQAILGPRDIIPLDDARMVTS